MAYTFAEVLNMTNVTKSRNIEEAHKVHIINTAQNMIWRGYDWSWTLDKLDPFWLVPRLQEYGAPIVAIPSDFDGLREAYLTFISPGAEPIRRVLRIAKNLDLTGVLGTPSAICWQKDRAAFRLHTRPGDSMCAPRYMVEGTYKKKPTQITVSTYQTSSLPSDDKFLDMWRKTINWAYLDFSQDQRAGGIQMMPSGIPNYYGAFGEAFAAIRQSASEEGLTEGDPMIRPEQALLINDPRWQGFFL